ncbi:ABC transporter permease [Methanospirillum stamsii]|uniref:ABC transporter permease n=1 Tax=Methanospirillum stamsii TaxID=1277351 RepID=A0A2V2NE04_9EURY|nr:ABC transporter permease [Methanospirillum stamsii]PWR75816.1 ABC transporter permease [Methanospirillum stamsii]
MNLTAPAIEQLWTIHDITDQTMVHLTLFFSALIIVLILGLALGIAAGMNKRWGGILIQILNVIEMIPDIALLLLLIPITGIGAVPTIVAAVLYSLLPIVRNTSIGIISIRPELIENGIALGMTEKDMLLRIRLPLALPLIAGGIRTAVIYTMGIVTLGGIIGARGLGAVLQAGITRNNMTVILIAGLWIGILAICMDLFAAGGERILIWKYGDKT